MENLKYFLKRPGVTRKTFAIVCYRPITRTKKEYLELPESIATDVESINQKLLKKLISRVEAEVVLKELIATQYRKSKVQAMVLRHTTLSEVNAKLLRAFWAEKYEVRYLEDEASARADFERAFRAIEPLSIQAASQGELQKLIKKQAKSVSQIRRISDRLNEVLKWLKRDFKLEKPKKPRKEIKHITRVEMAKLVPHISCPDCRLLAVSLFISGARLGEAMALVPNDLRGLELSITKQRRVYGTDEIRSPKREKTGNVAILEFGRAELESWINLENKWSHRWHFGKLLAEACKSTKLKRISPHDLRHSHAIHLLTLGATLTEVSMNLRNRIEVCQEYYTGYAHSEGTLDRLKRLTSEDQNE